MTTAVRPSFGVLLQGLAGARTRRRLASLKTVLGYAGAARGRNTNLRRGARGVFLTELSRRYRERAPRPRDGVPDVLGVLGLADDPVAHAALLAWAMDRDGEHGLGDAVVHALRRAVGLAPGGRPARVSRVGATVLTVADGERVEYTLTRPSRTETATREALGIGSMLAGPMEHPGTDRGEGVLDGGAVRRAVAPVVLLEVLKAVGPGARGEGALLLTAWERSIRGALPGRTTMAEWTGLSSDVRYLLEHWEEYLDVLAVREQMDREFVQVRYRLLDALREKYPADGGWESTVDEDWILLRRKDWPIPGEEWLAFVVVLPDVESVMTEGRDGWWSAVSLPTDGDFDAESFTSMVRARMDAGAWREHLAQRWPGHAVARNLPRLDPQAVLAGKVEETALEEFARYVQLVPWIDQALRDLR